MLKLRKHSNKQYSKAAVIVDTRNILNLPNIISKHMKFLNGWQLFVFHGKDNKHLFEETENKVIINNIYNRGDYNRLLTSNWFWHNIPAEKILIFQHDSMLLRKGIDEFLDWDYIGAPIPGCFHLNGGFSLRTRDVMLDCIGKFPYRHGNEDNFFSTSVVRVGMIAPLQVARKFSIEQSFSLGSLGYHAIDRYHSPNSCNLIKNQYKNNIALL